MIRAPRLFWSGKGLWKLNRGFCKPYTTQAITTNSSSLQISDEVRDAVNVGKPVVALESTIYTHGFPYPENIALASLLESAVRANSGIPATIGVLDGIARVGMVSEEIIELLETAGRPDTIKVSRRDLGYICGLGMTGRKLNGGTTIAGALVLAHLAGIKVFATGGLGGVHKGGENSMDISADLTELGRTPVALISSGCKSFLDIPRTLEYLETQGVGVGTFADGRSGRVEFPAFWTRESGFSSPTTIQDEKEAAAIIYAQSKLSLTSGQLFANPIFEKHSLPKPMMDRIMNQAVQEAEQQGIYGNDNTPFVLSRIRSLTQGATVHANRELVHANVVRGTKVAVELAKLYLQEQVSLDHDRSYRIRLDSASNANGPQVKGKRDVDIFVAGSTAVDLSCNCDVTNTAAPTPSLHTSNPAVVTESVGGVAHNVATASHYCGANVRLCSVVGSDEVGRYVIQDLRRRGLDATGIKVLGHESRTARYVAVNDVRRNLFLGMADMKILESEDIDFDGLWKSDLETNRPKWLVVDANWSSPTLRKWIATVRSRGTKIAYEPVSVAKSERLFHESWKDHLKVMMGESSTGSGLGGYRSVDLATPNEIELHAMCEKARCLDAWSTFLAGVELSDIVRYVGSRQGRLTDLVDSKTVIAAIKLLSAIPCILTKLGANGVLLTEFLRTGDQRLNDLSKAEHIFFRRSSAEQVSDKPSLVLPETEQGSSLFGIEGVYIKHFPAEVVLDENILSVNGVGDTFLGVLLANLVRKDGVQSIEQAIPLAQKGAILTLKSYDSVSPAIKSLAG